MSPVTAAGLDSIHFESQAVDNAFCEAVNRVALAVLKVGKVPRASSLSQATCRQVKHAENKPGFPNHQVMVKMELIRWENSFLFFEVRGSTLYEPDKFMKKLKQADPELFQPSFPYEIQFSEREQDRSNLILTLIPKQPEVLMPMSLLAASAASPQSQ